MYKLGENVASKKTETQPMSQTHVGANLVFARRTKTDIKPKFENELETFASDIGSGRAPAEAILDMQSRLKENPISINKKGIQVNWSGEGEWKITLNVFSGYGNSVCCKELKIRAICLHFFFHDPDPAFHPAF